MLLVIDNRFLEPLRQVYAVDGAEAFEVVRAKEHTGEIMPLAVEQVAQFQQESVTGQVVKPIDGLQIVAHPVACPECPVAQRFSGRVFNWYRK